MQTIARIHTDAGRRIAQRMTARAPKPRPLRTIPVLGELRYRGKTIARAPSFSTPPRASPSGCSPTMAANCTTRTSAWRSSSAVQAPLARRPSQARAAAAWSVIAFESLFRLAILAGPKGALVFLGIGVVFHLANAAVMGLNNFVWAFTATYPAVHYCAERMQTLLRG
jgi:hypothetical protein